MSPKAAAPKKASNDDVAKPKSARATKAATAAAAAAAAGADATTTTSDTPSASAGEPTIAAAAAAAAEESDPSLQRMRVRRFLVDRCGLSEIQAHDAEVGVYNWSLERADERRVPRNWRNVRFQALYSAKARSVAVNLDATSYVGNERLANRLAEGEFLPHDITTMQPENVFPERWRDVVEMKVRRDEYISNARPSAMTDQFRCGRCKKRECSYMELQTRSCDEPATLFIQCLRCGHRWRMG